MNKVVLIGRLTKDPATNEALTMARYTLAVDRKFKKEGQPDADFISCLALGKTAEFVAKYLKKGTKIAIEGEIRTGSYEKDGRTVYTTDVLATAHEFVESKNASNNNSSAPTQPTADKPPVESFNNIPEGVDEQLPF